jgi:hypothetical protein
VGPEAKRGRGDEEQDERPSLTFTVEAEGVRGTMGRDVTVTLWPGAADLTAWPPCGGAHRTGASDRGGWDNRLRFTFPHLYRASAILGHFGG